MTETYSFKYINKGLKKMGSDLENYSLKTNNKGYIDIIETDVDSQGNKTEKVYLSGEEKGWVPFGIGGKTDIDTLEDMSKELSKVRNQQYTEFLSDLTKPSTGLEKAVTTSIIVLSVSLLALSSLKMTGNVIAESSKLTNSIIAILVVILIILGFLFNRTKKRKK